MGNENSSYFESSSSRLKQKGIEHGVEKSKTERVSNHFVKPEDVCSAISELSSQNGCSFRDIKNYLLNMNHDLEKIPNDVLDASIKMAMNKSLRSGTISKRHGRFRYESRKRGAGRRSRGSRSRSQRRHRKKSSSCQICSKPAKTKSGRKPARKKGRAKRKGRRAGKKRQTKKSRKRSVSTTMGKVRVKRTKRDKKGRRLGSSGSFTWFWDKLMGRSKPRASRSRSHQRRERRQGRN